MTALSSGTISTSAPGYHKNTEQPNFLCTRHKRHSEGGGLDPSTRGALLREDAELFHLWTLRKQDSASLNQESSAQLPITWIIVVEFQQQKSWVRAWRGEYTGSLLPLSYRLLDVCAAKCAKVVARTEGQERLDTGSEPSLGGHCSVDFQDQQ